ncbi:MAG: LysM peptidoglycan-binding domain-containing protein, partial [Firmicutes bacterium]|nr:LysM peptidoglycan-binding domain-containing protein [Bacillota bacterium]
QELLKAQGLFTCTPDGNFGPHTEDSVRLFQNRVGLTADAVVGPDTWAALNNQPYVVRYDDTFALLAERFGTTVQAWQEANPEVKPDNLSVGMSLKMPTLPLRPAKTPSRGGERPAANGRLVSWSEANREFANKSKAQVTDIDTGLCFWVRRRGGYNHADVEPLTAADTKVLRQIYGTWSWERRAVVVDYGSGPVAASMNGMPHGGDSLSGNNFPGHICFHFVGSKTHGSNRVDPDHQAMIRKAAGN